MKDTSAATTRSISRRPARAGSARRLLARDQIVPSPETGLQYRAGDFLGEGGFGQVYLARRLGRSSKVAELVCVMV